MFPRFGAIFELLGGPRGPSQGSPKVDGKIVWYVGSQDLGTLINHSGLISSSNKTCHASLEKLFQYRLWLFKTCLLVAKKPIDTNNPPNFVFVIGAYLSERCGDRWS